MITNNMTGNRQEETTEKVPGVSRRRFLQFAGGIAGAGILLSAEACKRTPPNTTYVGSGDVGLLNYIYILQQLEAAFYTQAALTPYLSIDRSELDLINQLRDIEIGHREFMKKLLGKDAISPITVDLSAVTFADRSSVVKYGAIFEDMVVSGLNGAVQLFSNHDYILTISKMAAVEARHAAYMRDLQTPNSFADSTVVSATGLDLAAAPLVVMTAAEQYIQTKFDTAKLPTY